MKVSDYIIKFLSKITDSVFLLPGGAIMHLVDSLAHSDLDVYCCHHEQACVTAAEGYAKIKKDIGVAIVTSGPGATNAITGVVGAWQSSAPLLVISGQVKTADLMPRDKNNIPTVRQMGFQEINIIDIVRPICKYSVMIKRKENISYHLEKAVYLAKAGRPGPVWLDIPLDISSENVNANYLKKWNQPDSGKSKYKVPIERIVDKLEKAKRPLLLVGSGVKISRGVDSLTRLLTKTKINVVTSLFASDIIPIDYPYYLGIQGMQGHQSANWAVDNCDLLLTIGERLSLSQTSYNYKEFATQADLVMVDIDPGELAKSSLSVDIPVCIDAKEFLDILTEQSFNLNSWPVRFKPIVSEDYQGDQRFVNVYRFMEELNINLFGHHVVTTCGQARFVPHQILKMSKGYEFVSTTSLRQMGCGLPLAVGACIASDKKPVICMTGDGSIMLNIQELQTIIHHQLPIKIFLFNNNGYNAIRNTHKRYFNRVFAADPKTGVSFPNFEKLMYGWGIEYLEIAGNRDLHKVKTVLKCNKPIVCELKISPAQPMPANWSAGEFRNQELTQKVEKHM